MGATMRRAVINEKEIHISTGKLEPEGTPHDPEWGEWFNEGPVQMRHCNAENCDLDDYRKYEDE